MKFLLQTLAWLSGLIKHKFYIFAVQCPLCASTTQELTGGFLKSVKMCQLQAVGAGPQPEELWLLTKQLPGNAKHVALLQLRRNADSKVVLKCCCMVKLDCGNVTK